MTTEKINITLKKLGPTSDLRDIDVLDPKKVPGWGSDTLTMFAQHFFNHVLKTSINIEPLVQRCRTLDHQASAFFVQSATDGYPLPLILMVRAHSAWRAAFILSSAGQHFESTAAMRQSLECLGYAMIILRSEEARDVWRDRKDKLSKFRKCFSTAEMQKAMPSAIHVPEFWRHVYERIIALGAHPNEEGVWSSTPVKHFRDDTYFANVVYLSNDKNSYERSFSFIIANIRILLYCISELNSEIFSKTIGAAALDPIRKIEFP